MLAPVDEPLVESDAEERTEMGENTSGLGGWRREGRGSDMGEEEEEEEDRVDHQFDIGHGGSRTVRGPDRLGHLRGF